MSLTYTWSMSQCVDPLTRVIDWGTVGPMLDAIEEGQTHDVPPATLAILADAFTVAVRSVNLVNGRVSHVAMGSGSYFTAYNGRIDLWTSGIELVWGIPPMRNVSYDAHPLPVGERHWPEFQKRDAIGFLRRLAECVRKGQYTIPEDDDD